MTRQMFGPRKRRTRQHIIADLSIHHVEGFILEEGHTSQRLGSDYGYDLFMCTFDARGYAEPGSIYFQLKAMETLNAIGTDYIYDLDLRDYNLWMAERTPVILVLFDATRKRACWLWIQGHFRDDTSRQPAKGARTVRVRMPQRQAVNRRAIAKIRKLKQTTQAPLMGEQS